MTRDWFYENYIHNDNLVIIAIFTDGALAYPVAFPNEAYDITFTID